MVELSPTVRKWAVAEGLKYMRLRYVEAVGMKAGSQGAVATRIQRKRASVGHWEEGRSLPDDKDIQAALELYGYSEHIPDFVDLSNVPRGEREWWDHTTPKDFLPDRQKSFLAFEHSAERLFAYEPQLVPDLLQTTDYAERLLRIERPEMGETEIRLSLMLLAGRQELLDGQHPLKCSWIIDEAALRREVGGRDVLREQLRQLVEQARRKNIELRVLTYEGSARAATRGGFTSLTLPLSFEPLSEVIYSPTAVEQVRYHDEHEVTRFHATAQRLRKHALSAKQSVALVEQIASELTG